MERDLRSIIVTSIGITFFIIVGIVGYLGFRKFQEGPQIINISITDFMTTSDGYLEFSGQVKNVHNIRINNREITINNDNSFADIVALEPGTNVVYISLEDALGKEREYAYTIYSTIPEELIMNYQDQTSPPMETEDADTLSETDTSLTEDNLPMGN